MYLEPCIPGYIIHCHNEAEWSVLMKYVKQNFGTEKLHWHYSKTNGLTAIRIRFTVGDSISVLTNCGEWEFYLKQGDYSNYIFLEFSEIDEYEAAGKRDMLSAFDELL